MTKKSDGEHQRGQLGEQLAAGEVVDRARGGTGPSTRPGTLGVGLRRVPRAQRDDEPAVWADGGRRHDVGPVAVVLDARAAAAGRPRRRARSPPAKTSYALSTLPRVRPRRAAALRRVAETSGPTCTVQPVPGEGTRPVPCASPARGHADRRPARSRRSRLAPSAGSSPEAVLPGPGQRDRAVGRGHGDRPRTAAARAGGEDARAVSDPAASQRRGERSRSRSVNASTSAEVVHEPRGGQALEEAPPVGLLDQPAVEDGEDAAVGGGADQPAEPLLQHQDRHRHLVLVERVAARGCAGARCAPATTGSAGDANGSLSMITHESCSPATSTPCQKDAVASSTAPGVRAEGLEQHAAWAPRPASRSG